MQDTNKDNLIQWNAMNELLYNSDKWLFLEISLLTLVLTESSNKTCKM